MRTDLYFERGLPLHGSPLLGWLPDETLFSLVSRLHRIWGRQLAADTARLLFGGKIRGTHHDFPSALAHFESKTDGQFGTSNAIARGATLLRFFEPFLESDAFAAAVETMESSSVAHLKYQLGLLTSRFRANHPLKACPTCMVVDEQLYQWVYWHLSHQFPGVWHCPIHGDELMSSALKSTGVQRFQWVLPDSGDLTYALQKYVPLDSGARRSLSGTVYSLVADSAPGSLGFAAVQRVLWREAQTRGWVTAGGSLRVELAANSYLSYCEQISGPCELSDLPADLKVARLHVARLLRPIRSGTHPLRLLLGAHWLYGEAEAFRSAIGSSSNGLKLDAALPAMDQKADRERIISRLSEGQSPTAVAAELGLDFSTVAAVAAAAGIKINRRPKRVRDDLLVSLTTALRKGDPVAEISERFGVSVVTLNRMLRTNPELAAKRDRVIRESRLAKARAQWISLLAAHPALGIKLTRAIDPALYAWLYRNDRLWLAEHSPRLEARILPSSPVDWNLRDERLAVDVQKALASMAQTSMIGPRLWQIYQVVPDLNAKLGQLHRLPRTQAVLERALGKPVRPKHSLI